jgi:hypothetical protein
MRNDRNIKINNYKKKKSAILQKQVKMASPQTPPPGREGL